MWGSRVQITGKYQKEFSSRQDNAIMNIDGGRYELSVDGEVLSSGELDSLSVSDKLANTSRKIKKVDDWVFITSSDSVDEIFGERSLMQSRMHKIESNRSMVLIAVVAIALFGYSFMKWGVPFVSNAIAYSLPLETNQIIAKDAMEMLDEHIFSDTNLSKSRQDEITKHFTEKIQPLIQEEHLAFKLHFRKWEMGSKSIPNAMALPSGDIVLTDRFVELAKNNDELDSVLLHEVGHVVYRHTLKSTIEGIFVSVLTTMLFGDTSGLGDLATGLGSFLMNSKYSRDHESEADIYAFNKMLKAGIDPHSFSLILDKISSDGEGKKSKNKSISDESTLDYLSSHPATDNRVKIADAFSKCFKEKRTECEIDIEEIVGE